MIQFGVPDLLDSKLTLRNVDFKSQTDAKNSFVFHKPRRRASFLDAVNFTYGEAESANPSYTLYLAAGHIDRLAMTSATSAWTDAPVGDSLLFDSRYGVHGLTSGKTMLGPPFDEMPGVEGNRIYPHPGNDLSKFGWGGEEVDYWVYSNGEWREGN